MADSPLGGLVGMLRAHGAERIFLKRMAENDNSKNQVYFGGSFSLLLDLPLQNFRAAPSDNNRAIVHADFPVSWMRSDGSLAVAPRSKLILYPQYPEVRWSGFLAGASGAPSALMNEHARIAGRILVVGVIPHRSAIAAVFEPGSPIANELEHRGTFRDAPALVELQFEPPLDTRDRLLAALRMVARRGWIEPVRLRADGTFRPCSGPNCGGVTLESHLGIMANSKAEPDLFGWEVKQFGVHDFKRFRAKSPITVFTPEPTDGVYATEGVISFIRRWGYADTKGRPDRLNVGGRFTIGKRLDRTGLTLRLTGVGSDGFTIADSSGGIELQDDAGVIAARWPFPALLEHWNRKHAQTVFVPSLRQVEPTRYRYSADVFLGTGTDFGLFLRSLAHGSVAYDPGIKLEGAASANPIPKRRSQFRVPFAELDALYHRFEAVQDHSAG